MNPINSMEGILSQLYDGMIPLFSQFIGVSMALGGLGALWFIAYRVWGHIARAEAVDVYPLLRPFALGMAILLYNSLLPVLNGVLQPTVTVTEQVVQGTGTAIAALLQERQTALQQGGDWENYASGDALADDLQFGMSTANPGLENMLLEGLSKVLEILYEGAALIILLIRTFILIVLSIMGPLVIGLSVFDGFRHSLQHWLARYINVFLWLPVANIYGAVIGKVQELMLQESLQQNAGGAFSASGLPYILFLLMGIAGYCCVPATAGYIVQTAGGHALLPRINRAVSKLIH